MTIGDANYSSGSHNLVVKNAEGDIGIASEFIVCPNSECRKPTLIVKLRPWEVNRGTGGLRAAGPAVQTWRLIPQGVGKPFPGFVPQAIRDDYRESCLIRDLSPKSSATLARRALQGILRDFYKVKPGRLVDEIDSLENTMDPPLWEAIHGVRQVGNIGAHMEADINVIVEVDPEEAQLLIELVETMIEETYVHRDARDRRVRSVKAMAAAKQLARTAIPASKSGDNSNS